MAETYEGETVEQMRKRSEMAMRRADEKCGQYRSFELMSAVGFFFAGSFPAYIALLAFGLYRENMEIPLILAGLFVVGARYILDREHNSMWRKEYERHMESTRPQ